MLTEKDYCDLGCIKALESLGMNVYTSFCGVEVLKHLSLYEAQKWLREEKHLHITIYSQSQESWQYRITKPHQKLEDGLHGEDFSSFEEALSEGIKETVKILRDERID